MVSTGTKLIQNFKSSVSVAVILEMLRPFRILIMIQQPMMQRIDLLPCTMGSLMSYVASKKCVKTNVRSGYPELLNSYSAPSTSMHQPTDISEKDKWEAMSCSSDHFGRLYIWTAENDVFEEQTLQVTPCYWFNF